MAGQEPERPSFLQHLMGSGVTMDAWRKQRKQVRQDYERSVRQMMKAKPRQEEDFEESIEEQRESFMRRAGIPQFINRSPTADEMKGNFRLRRINDRYSKQEKRMRKNYSESQRDARNDLKKQYHKQLKEVSRQLREGKLAPPAKETSTVSVTQHLMGRPQSAMPKQPTISPGRHFSGISRQHSSRA